MYCLSIVKFHKENIVKFDIYRWGGEGLLQRINIRVPKRMMELSMLTAKVHQRMAILLVQKYVQAFKKRGLKRLVGFSMRTGPGTKCSGSYCSE